MAPLLSAVPNVDCAPGFTRIGAPVSIPARVSSHILLVDVRINDLGPFHMLVDTGCTVPLISPELAMAVGAIDAEPSEGRVLGSDGLGNPTSMRRVLLTSVDLGGARFEGVTAVVSNTFEQFSRIADQRVDGLLGFSLFNDLFLTLDFPNRRVLLSADWPKNVPPIRAELPVVENTGVPFVSLQIQGKQIPVMIDSGSDEDFHLPSGFSPAMRWKGEPRPGTLIAAVGGVDRDWVGRLSGTLRLGAVRQPEPATSVSTGPASIGARLLENFCVVFHESGGRMWLCSDSNEAVPSPVEYSVGLSLVLERGGWRVAGIIPGSPAEDAHLSPGQLVTQIEGRPAGEWTRDQIQQWIDSHDAVALVVAGPSGQQNLSLRAWPLVP